MTAALDTSVLLYLLNDKTPPPKDKNTGLIVEGCSERVAFLISRLDKAKRNLIVPSPVLAEAFTRAALAGPEYLSIIEREKSLRVADFNKLAAIEAAAIMQSIYTNGGKPAGNDARSKLKFDVMIFAIARVNGASTIYSDDNDIAQLGKRYSVEVIGIGDLPLPDAAKQMDIFSSAGALDSSIKS